MLLGGWLSQVGDLPGARAAYEQAAGAGPASVRSAARAAVDALDARP
ncbi:MAG: hypothetical protein R3F60_33690 [bacterium]